MPITPVVRDASAGISPAPTYWYYRGLCAGPSRYVASVRRQVGGTFYSYLMSSPDGETWTDRLNISAYSAVLQVFYLNGLYFAVTEGSSQYWTSTDGDSWTLRSFGSQFSALYLGRRNMCYGASKYVAVKDNTNVISSVSGTGTWVVAATVSQTGPIAFGNGVFVMIEDFTGNGYKTSSNATSWTDRTLPSDFGWVYEVNFLNGRFIVIGEDSVTGRLLSATSTDGISWTLGTVISESGGANNCIVAYGGGVFALTIRNSSPHTDYVLVSPDGLTWEVVDITSYVDGTLLHGAWNQAWTVCLNNQFLTGWQGVKLLQYGYSPPPTQFWDAFVSTAETIGA